MVLTVWVADFRTHVCLFAPRELSEGPDDASDAGRNLSSTAGCGSHNSGATIRRCISGRRHYRRQRSGCGGDQVCGGRGGDARRVGGNVSERVVAGVTESGDHWVAMSVNRYPNERVVEGDEVAGRASASDQERGRGSGIEGKPVECLGDEDRRSWARDCDSNSTVSIPAASSRVSTSARASSPPDGATSPTVPIVVGHGSMAFGRSRVEWSWRS